MNVTKYIKEWKWDGQRGEARWRKNWLGRQRYRDKRAHSSLKTYPSSFETKKKIAPAGFRLLPQKLLTRSRELWTILRCCVVRWRGAKDDLYRYETGRRPKQSPTKFLKHSLPNSLSYKSSNKPLYYIRTSMTCSICSALRVLEFASLAVFSASIANRRMNCM